MMKKILHILFCICPLLLASAHITAQTCNANFTVSTQITNSTCQSNGEIRVTLSGDNISDLINVQYGLTSTTPGGFSIDPRTDPVLKNIPPGSYELTVRAFCNNDADFDVVKKVTGLVVGGNYTVPVASLNATSSRKPYSGCNTGIIVLNVTGGSGTFTFTITSAPAGVATGVITPTKNGTTYTLPGESYPQGNYTIQVEDGCFSVACNFVFDAITSFPTFVNETSAGFRPDVDNTAGSCNYLKWHAYSSNVISSADFKRYFDAGLYEVGAAPAGQTPTSWTAWTENVNNQTFIFLNVSPYNASDFFTANSVEIFIRIKGCSSSGRSFTTNTVSNTSTSVFNRNNDVITMGCDTYEYRVNPKTGSGSATLCYPLDVTLKKTSGGGIIYSEPEWYYKDHWGIPITLDYDVSHTLTIIDANGTKTELGVGYNRKITPGNQNECAGWKMSYNLPKGYDAVYTCLPAVVNVFDPVENVVWRDTLTEYGTRYTDLLEYDKTYKLTLTYANGYTHIATKSVASDRPTSVSLITETESGYDKVCYVDRGCLKIISGNGKAFPIGTTFTIESKAEGFTTQTATTTNSTYAYYRFSNITIPADTYKVTVDYGCGEPIIDSFYIAGIYNYKDFDYTTENTCSGLKVKPSGIVTHKGVDLPNGTYFYLVSGPSGYDTTVKMPGDSIFLQTVGTYVLGISGDANDTRCAYTSYTIEYSPVQLALDVNFTSAYVCVGGSVANISIKAINGIAPYTYELWDEDNTTKEPVSDITTSGTALFNYGSANITYTVRISDACGNSFNQQITVTNLKTARIVYSEENELCAGNTISLNCITLGTTTYSWTGPNGFTSTNQSPMIPNAQQNMSGWYKVSVMPEYCGMAVEDSVYITVYPPLAAGASVGDQTTCVRTTPSLLGSETAGGKGTYAYQWQSSTDAVSWTDIPNATQATYQPPVQLQAGSLYYRKATTDDCHTVYSTPVLVVMKSCYIPVNPYIRHME